MTHKSGMTLDRAARQWAKGRAARREVSPKTLVNYKISFGSFYQFVPGRTPLAAVTTDHIEHWLSNARTRRGERYHPNSLNALASPVRTFFAWAHRRRMIRYDPCELIPSSKVPKRVPRTLAPDVVADYLAVADERAAVIFLTGLHTGVRLGELTALDIDDWDRRRNELYVIGKGDKERVVPIVDELAVELERWTTSQGIASGPLWPTRVHHRVYLTPQRMGQIITGTGRRAGHRIRPHDMRRTCATNLARAGVDVAVIKELLGHESLATTTAYVDMGVDHVRRAIEGKVSYRPRG